MHSVRPRRWDDWSVPHRPMYLRVDPLLAEVVADVVRGLEVADLCLLYFCLAFGELLTNLEKPIIGCVDANFCK